MNGPVLSPIHKHGVQADKTVVFSQRKWKNENMESIAGGQRKREGQKKKKINYPQEGRPEDTRVEGVRFTFKTLNNH